MNNIRLSICIPTYNRGEIVYRTVKNILRYEGQNIEVVVSNNCSEDNTEELIKSISDERVKYYKNSYNNVGDNLITVLTYGTGDYLLLLSDEDDVLLDSIPHLLEILAKEEPAVLVGSTKLNGVPAGVFPDRTYQPGRESLIGYGWGVTYISGYVYNKKIMRKVMGDLYGENINRIYGSGYNFTNLARKMLEFGKFMTIKDFLTDQRESGKKDFTSYFDGGVYAYAPEKKLKCAIDAVDALSTVNLCLRDKLLLIQMYKMRLCASHRLDWEATFEEKFEKRCETDVAILEYYLDNREKIRGINYYRRLRTNLKKYNKYVNENVFGGKYLYFRIRYLKICPKNIIKVARKMMWFAVHKLLVEYKCKENNK